MSWQLRTFIFGTFLCLALGLESKGDDVSGCYKDEKNLMLWDMTDYCVSKAKEIYFGAPKEPNSGLSAIGKREKSRPYLEKAKQLILELEEIYLRDEPDTEQLLTPLPDPEPCSLKPSDCSDVLAAGQTSSGVYKIWPSGRPLEVHCDMDTDGGGWTVIQRRGNFSNQEDFFRSFDDYEDGFGDVTRDFWFGNENIYLIANQSECEIRFDLADATGERRFAVYKTFRLDDGSKNYTLHIGNYSGDAGDSMAYHNGHMFSTKDFGATMCANQRMGGWWYDYCTESNLNGLYRPGEEGTEGITWYSWHHHTSLAGSEIKLRKAN